MGNRTGAGAPRDDRAWPPWSTAFSVVVSLGRAAAVVVVAALREEQSQTVLVSVLAVVAAVLSGWATWDGSRALIDGRPTPGWVSRLLIAMVAACFVGWVTRPVLGICGFLGMLAGIFAVNVVAQRSARRNRAVVESLQREEDEVDRAYEDRRTQDERLRPPTGDARLGQLLRTRRAKERRNLVAWLFLSAVPLLLGGVILQAPVGLAVTATVADGQLRLPVHVARMDRPFRRRGAKFASKGG